MNGPGTVVMGARGRLVIPSETRREQGWDEGTVIVLLKRPEGMVLVSRDQLEARVQAAHKGLGLVDELIAERRRAATEEDRSCTS